MPVTTARKAPVVSVKDLGVNPPRHSALISIEALRAGDGLVTFGVTERGRGSVLTPLDADVSGLGEPTPSGREQ